MIEKAPSDKCNSHESITRTLAISELLEMILLHLDMKTLLLAQRANIQWRNAIATSSKLQKKLFFLPVQSFNEAVSLNMVGNNTVVNVWIRGPPQDIVLPNPLLHDYDVEDENDHIGGIEEKVSERSAFHLPLSIVQGMPAFQRGKSSWERMFITQPPESSIKVYVEHYSASSAQKVPRSSDLDLHMSSMTIECVEERDLKLRRIVDEVDKEVCESGSLGKHRMPLWARGRLDLFGYIMLFSEVLQWSATGKSFDF